MGTTESNRHRIDWLLSRLSLAKTKDKDIDKVKLVAICAIETGCSLKTSKQALKTLVDAGKVSVNESTAWI